MIGRLERRFDIPAFAVILRSLCAIRVRRRAGAQAGDSEQITSPPPRGIKVVVTQD